MLEITYKKKHVFIYEKKQKKKFSLFLPNEEIITCMSLDKFNEYVKRNNYLIVEREKY